MGSNVRAWVVGVGMLAAVPACQQGERLDGGADAAVAGLTIAAHDSPAAHEAVARLKARFQMAGPSAVAGPSPGPARTAALGPSAAEAITREGGRLRVALSRALSSSLAHPAEVELPARADGALRLVDRGSGLSVWASLVGATGAPAQVADGYAVYAGGHALGDLVHRPVADGNEDYLHLAARPPVESVRYTVTPGAKVAGLRLVSDSLEFLDERGTPRLRIAPPFLVDADGDKRFARLTVEGCHVDTSAAPPWDRAVTPPGDAPCTVTIDWSGAGVRYPALLDPAWTATGNMSTQRYQYPQSNLAGSRVMVSGGQGAGSIVEIYDANTGTWAGTGNMITTRYGHTTTLLGNGKTLAAGNAVFAAETWDPNTGVWTSTPNMVNQHAYQTATVLGNGKVLIAAGVTINANTMCDLYDPSNNSWANTGRTGASRQQHTAHLLGNGKVILIGGSNYNSTSELYDPNTGTWSNTGALGLGRRYHTSTLLGNGKVLVAGGEAGGGQGLTSVEVYDPNTGIYTAAPGLNVPRQYQTATLLQDGKIIVAGGYGPGINANAQYLSSSELYDPNTTNWTLSATMVLPRIYHAAVLLPSGKALISGGYYVNGGTTFYLAASELFDEAANGGGGGGGAIKCNQNGDCQTGFCADGVCCNNACTGYCQSCNLQGSAGTCTSVAQGGVGSPSCAPYVCDGANGDCPVSCQSDANCTSGYTCKGGACVVKFGDGTACMGGNQCASGNCADGVCCNAPCAGGCDVCTKALGAASDGACTVVGGPGSPSCAPYVCDGAGGNCPASCVSDNQCAGGLSCIAGKCGTKAQNGAACNAANQCASGFCVDGVCCNSLCGGGCDRCDLAGNGTCTVVGFGSAGAAPVCAPYLCDGVAAACPTSCIGDTNCAGGWCSNKVCVARLGNGQACGGANQCQSGFCVDGVCCNSQCGGSCARCDLQNSLGACTALGAGNPGRAAACAPYGCDGQAMTCPSSCANDQGCLAGNFCLNGKCTAKLANGASCGGAAACVSGFCVDGYCCNAACAGGCDRCDLANTLGACTLVAQGGAGANPSCGAYVCDGASASCPAACVADNQCIGGYACVAGKCVAKVGVGTPCASANQCQTGFCADGYCCNSACAGGCDRCDLMGAQGSCTLAMRGDPGANPGCAPYLCDGAGASCPRGCAVDGDCANGYFCANGACAQKVGLGQACSGKNQCASGFCADGYCCNAACAGGCDRCDVKGALGTCTVAQAGDPGAGPACAPYLCDGSGGACPTGCAGDGNCAPGGYCAFGVCAAKQMGGSACAAGTQCASGFCVDGVCCDGACGDQCAACNLPNLVGKCSPVKGRPVGVRKACGGVGTCEGVCDGNRADRCAFPDAQTVCAAPSCGGGAATDRALCDGAGGCTPGAKTLCPAGCRGDVCAERPDGGVEPGPADMASASTPDLASPAPADLASAPADLASAPAADLASAAPDLAEAAAPKSGGCGCAVGRVSSTNGGGPWLVLIGLAALVWRRRRAA